MPGLHSSDSPPTGGSRRHRRSASLAQGMEGPSSATPPLHRRDIVQLSASSHFHYEASEVGELRLRVGLDSAGTAAQSPLASHDSPLVLRVESAANFWRLQRSWRQLLAFDADLHTCVFERSFSRLPDLAAALPLHRPFLYDKELEQEIVGYWHRFSRLCAGASVTCHSVLGWLEVDKRGNRLLTAEETPINTPAMAAAFAKKPFAASLPEHLPLQQGDIVSVIDMSDPVWWKGKLTIALSAQLPARRCLRQPGLGAMEEGVPVSASSPALPDPSHYASSSLSLAKKEAPSSGAYFKVGFFPADSVQLFGEKAGGSKCELGATSILPSSSGVLSPDSSPSAARKGRLLAFLRGFLLTRPSRRNLKASGILKERVFGCDLSELLANSGESVPLVLRSVSAAIEAVGHVDGIYRLSGRVSNINRMRVIFDEGREPAELGAGARGSLGQLDVHSLASLLKAFFRELPNPLFTSALCPAFEAVLSQHSEPGARVPALTALVRSLPPPHLRTAAFLMAHLHRVAQWAPSTGMHHQNLAIVWAPNLFRSREAVGPEACGSMLRSVNVQAVVTAYLIKYHSVIFAEAPGEAAPHHRSMSSIPSLAGPASPPQLPSRPSSALVSSSPSPGQGPHQGPAHGHPASPAQRLLHLGAAQAKLDAARWQKIPDGLGLPDLSHRKCIDVNGGPDAIPEFHTVLEVRGKRRGRREAGEGWRHLFGKRRGGAVEDEEGGAIPGLHVKGWDARRLSKRRSTSAHKATPTGAPGPLDSIPQLQASPPPARSARLLPASQQPDFRSQPDLRGLAEQEIRDSVRGRGSSPSPPEVPPPPSHYAQGRRSPAFPPRSDVDHWGPRDPSPGLARSLHTYDLSSPASSAQPSPQLRLGEEAANHRPPPHSDHLHLSPEWLRAHSDPLAQPSPPLPPQPTLASLGPVAPLASIVPITPSPQSSPSLSRESSLGEEGPQASPLGPSFAGSFRDAAAELFCSALEPDDGARESRLIEELKDGNSPSREDLAALLPPELGQIYHDVNLTSSFETAAEETPPPSQGPLPPFDPEPEAPTPVEDSPHMPRLRLTAVSVQEDAYVEETLPLPSADAAAESEENRAPSPLPGPARPSSSIRVISFEPPLLVSDGAEAEGESASDCGALAAKPVPAPRRSISQPPGPLAPLGPLQGSTGQGAVSAISIQLRSQTGGARKGPGSESGDDELRNSPLFRKQAEALSDVESVGQPLAEAAEPLGPALVDPIPEGELRFFPNGPPPQPNSAQMFFV